MTRVCGSMTHDDSWVNMARVPERFYERATCHEGICPLVIFRHNVAKENNAISFDEWRPDSARTVGLLIKISIEYA